MKERPLLFSAPMVRALIAGTKSQTRRVVKAPGWDPASPEYGGLTGIKQHADERIGLQAYFWHARSALAHGVRCPYGQPGDRLWVRETWQHYQNSGQRAADFSEHQRFAANCFYRADESNPRTKPLSGKWRPSLLMPRWACRLVLPLVSVRVERVQDITEEDAKAEGVERISAGPGWECWMGYGPSSSCKTARDSFRSLWISIYGEASWDLNPWVWVAEWEEIEVRK